LRRACRSRRRHRRSNPQGIAANKPYLIDVDIAADINPAGAGIWEFRASAKAKAGIGARFQPA